MDITCKNEEIYVNGIGQKLYVRDPKPGDLDLPGGGQMYGIDFMAEQRLAVVNTLMKRFVMAPEMKSFMIFKVCAAEHGGKNNG